MKSQETSRFLLSAIVPITLMAGRLNLLSDWVNSINHKQIEILLIHDIADVETGLELKEMLESNKNEKITLIEGVFGSPGNARNEGLLLAKGEWVTFWDCDDKPEVEEVLKTLENTVMNIALDVLIGEYNVLNLKSGTLTKKIPSDKNLLNLAFNPGIWRMVFRRETIKNQKFTSFKMAEDQNFISSIELPALKCKWVDRVFYTYYIGNNGQLTSSKVAINEILWAAKFTLKEMKKATSTTLEFNTVLFTRQVITGIIRGSLKVKIGCTALLFQAILIKGISISIIVLKTSFKIFFYGKRSRLDL